MQHMVIILKSAIEDALLGCASIVVFEAAGSVKPVKVPIGAVVICDEDIYP